MFTIKYDHLDHKPLDLSFGKSSTEPTHEFRLLDSDGVIYFSGFSTDNETEGLFAPLDYFGESYGCTDIAYKCGKRWIIC